jgi:hypothetical protein
MRKTQLTLRILSIAMFVLGLVVVIGDINLSGNLADALAGQPASLHDGGGVFTGALLAAAGLLVVGGVIGFVRSVLPSPTTRS